MAKASEKQTTTKRKRAVKKLRVKRKQKLLKAKIS